MIYSMNNCRNHIFPNYLAKVEIQPINTNEYTCIHMFCFLLNLIRIKKDMKDYTSACLHVDAYTPIEVLNWAHEENTIMFYYQRL